MDWVLGVTTLAVNTGLGVFKGAWWIWGLHFLNAAAWQGYIMNTGQWGFTILNVVTMGVDAVMMVRVLKKRKPAP